MLTFFASGTTGGASLRGPSLRGPSLNPNRNRNPPASLARVRREASRAAAVANPASLAAQSPSPSLNGRIIMVGAGKSPSHGVHLHGLSPSPNPNLSPRASLARDPSHPREASRAAAVASPESLAALNPSQSPNGPRLDGELGRRLSMMDGVSLCGASLSLSHRASLAKDQREASRDVAVASPGSQAVQSLSPNGPHLAGVSPSHGVHLHGPSPNPSPSLSHRASLARDPKVPRGASRVAAVASPASLAAQSQSQSPSPNGPRLSGEHGVHRNGLSPNPNPNHRASLAKDPNPGGSKCARRSINTCRWYF